MNSSMYRNLTITVLLALAIMIPIMMPLKVVIPPGIVYAGESRALFWPCSCPVRWRFVS